MYAPKVRYNGVNHIALATRDIDKTIRFWRDLLGMRMIVGIGRPGYRHYFFQVSDCCTVAFFEWKDVEPAAEKEHGRPVRGPFIFDHVSFGVEAKDDLWAMKQKLDAAGLWVSEVVDHGFILSIYSFDPNGIPLEFSWNVEGIDPRKTPLMADRNPTAVALEGPEPRPEHWPLLAELESDRKVYPGEGSRYFDDWQT